MSALLLTLTVDALLNPPSSTSENDVTAYGCLFAASTFFLAAGMLLSVTVMIQLNTIKWDTVHLTEALTKKGAQNVISVWSFQFFNIGVFLCIAGFNMAVWIVYDRTVFWVSIGTNTRGVEPSCVAGVMWGDYVYEQQHKVKLRKLYSMKASLGWMHPDENLLHCAIGHV